MTETEQHEGILSPEEQFDELESEFIGRLTERGLLLNRETYDWFIKSVKVTNLKDSEVAQAYNLEDVIATMNNGELSLDQEKFFSFSKEQQDYILSHESGHRLHQFLTQHDPDRYGQLLALVRALPPEQISYYSALTKNNFEEARASKEQSPEETSLDEARLLEEEMAELMAQYLHSDGSFPSIIRAKLLQFPGNSNEAGFWDQYEESAQIMEQLSALDFKDTAALTEFFHQHPALHQQYEMFRLIDGMMRDPQLAELFEDDHDLEEMLAMGPTFDTSSLVQEMPAVSPPLSGAQSPEKKQKIPPSSEIAGGVFLDLFSIFRSA